VPPIRHIVYECLPGAYAGGVQKMVFELASAQRRLGADVEIWTPNATRSGATEYFDALPVRYFTSNPVFGLACSYRLRREIEALPRHAVVHGHSTFNPLNMQVGNAAEKRGLRVFYHPHGALDPVLLSGWNFKALKKRAYIWRFTRPNFNRSTGVIALTPQERDQLRAIGIRAPVHVVPNGIHPTARGAHEAGLALRALHGLGHAERLALFVGRITPKKRIEDIIRAITGPDLHLFIAGNPEVEPAYAARLRAAAEAAGCAARIHWLGFMDEEAKSAAYAAADCFVHASESEGMALAILEAMSAGLPVVATQGCYMAEAARAGALVECAPGPKALTEALRSLLMDMDLAREQGRRGQAYVAAVHAWEAIARRTLRIYDGEGGQG
jgi:glycosyltransferase involved in cell wall biosynthesis